jgi:hypothetical protein
MFDIPGKEEQSIYNQILLWGVSDKISFSLLLKISLEKLRRKHVQRQL